MVCTCPKLFIIIMYITLTDQDKYQLTDAPGRKLNKTIKSIASLLILQYVCLLILCYLIKKEFLKIPLIINYGMLEHVNPVQLLGV